MNPDPSMATTENPTHRHLTVVSEFEGTLLSCPDTFPYFMLVAFEASGLLRFAILLLLWPVIRLLRLAGRAQAALRLTVFVAVTGVRVSVVKAVARAVLPKFFMEGTDVEAWRVFNGYERKVVLTECPSVMVEWFAREHLRADVVIGGELKVNRFGYATGFMVGGEEASIERKVGKVVGRDKGDTWLGREYWTTLRGCIPLMTVCQERKHGSFKVEGLRQSQGLDQPHPVIFHDGRLVPLPTPSTALLIILWIPVGIILALIRIATGLLLPLWAIPYARRVFGGQVIIRGCPPPPPVAGSTGGVLFVCTHRTLMDPVILSAVLRRRVPAVTYSISRLSEILSPIPTIRLSRSREADAEKIRRELSKGDLVVCPEGTTCREPFLLRFSALFAELTDRIVPVALNYRVGFFHATTARGWKALDPIFYFMNPRPVYEITFLDQLTPENTCAAGKSPHDVANYVQSLLANTLGFKCTNYTRKDKYRVLVGNDGTVRPRRFFSFSSLASSVSLMLRRARELLLRFVLHG